MTKYLIILTEMVRVWHLAPLNAVTTVEAINIEIAKPSTIWIANDITIKGISSEIEGTVLFKEKCYL